MPKSKARTNPLPVQPVIRRRWAARLGVMVLVPFAVLATLEMLLRLAGYGGSSDFFVKTGRGDTYTANANYLAQFFPKKTASRPFFFFMPANKPTNLIRIFIFGESAAMGTPDPAFSFGRILEEMLRRRHPDRQFEVINTAMRGINSHVIRPLARECAGHDPDLFLVYMGNNEVIGLHAPGPDSWRWTQNLALVRAGQWIGSTKLARLGRATARALSSNRKPMEAEVQDEHYFQRQRLAADDPRRAVVLDNFRANLEDICESAGRVHAPVLLATVGANLLDFPPLGSLHRPDLSAAEAAAWHNAYTNGVQAEAAGEWTRARTNYLTAARLDDHFAELHFRLGRCHLATQAIAEARKHFALARDWDALQFRADSQLNGIVRETAKQHQAAGTKLLDTEQALNASELAEHAIPGEKLFHDHVHPTFDGDYVLARAIYPAVVSALGDKLGPAAGEIPTRAECAEALAFTSWDEFNVMAAMAKLTARPPFTGQLDHKERQAAVELAVRNRSANLREPELQRARQIYESALQRRPADWKLHLNLGNLYQQLEQHTAAAGQFDYVVSVLPQVAPFRVAFGVSLARSGRLDAALVQFNEALRLDPDDAQAKDSLAWVRRRQGGR